MQSNKALSPALPLDQSVWEDGEQEGHHPSVKGVA